MKNNLRGLGDACWRILTEVPGWPDAPRRLRIRRVLPVLVPVAAACLLFLWNFAWIQPRIRAERTANQPLLQLEEEVAHLRLLGSDLHAAEVATRASEAAQLLLTKPKQLTAVLETFAQAARGLGWEAGFPPMQDLMAPPDPDEPLYFVTVRGKLVPGSGNAQPFPTLLALLEQFYPPDRSIDLTRLTVRADEQGRHSAEVHLRAGCFIPHEKAPE